MAPEERKRPPRIPLTSEEVSQLVAIKKLKEAKKLAKFKRTRTYKTFNVFNIVCFFIYWEVLFCFIGPCDFQTHFGRNYFVKRGDERNADGKRIVSELDIVSVNNHKYKLYVSDFIESPQPFSSFQLGKDYILRKDLKIKLNGSDASYGLQSAGSLIFLTVFILFISCIAFFYNLNENAHSLTGLAVLNAIILLAFVAI